jgi:hypothetical protein
MCFSADLGVTTSAWATRRFVASVRREQLDATLARA